MNRNNEYNSFMLRFRRMQNNRQPTWVVSLEAIPTGRVLCFPGVDGLVHFLQSEFGDSAEAIALDPNRSVDTEIPPGITEHEQSDC